MQVKLAAEKTQLRSTGGLWSLATPAYRVVGGSELRDGLRERLQGLVKVGAPAWRVSPDLLRHQPVYLHATVNDSRPQ